MNNSHIHHHFIYKKIANPSCKCSWELVLLFTSKLFNSLVWCHQIRWTIHTSISDIIYKKIANASCMHMFLKVIKKIMFDWYIIHVCTFEAKFAFAYWQFRGVLDGLLMSSFHLWAPKSNTECLWFLYISVARRGEAG